MKKIILVILGMVFLSGCAGINIKPITKMQENSDKRKDLNGYIVYSPKVFVHVRAVQGNCKISTFQMPDYEKPFVININSGFGKINANVKIVNGWMLGDITADIDNTSVLKNLTTKLTPLGQVKELPKEAVCGNLEEGIYSLVETNTAEIKLKKVTIVKQ